MSWNVCEWNKGCEHAQTQIKVLRTQNLCFLLYKDAKFLTHKNVPPHTHTLAQHNTIAWTQWKSIHIWNDNVVRKLYVK